MGTTRAFGAARDNFGAASAAAIHDFTDSAGESINADGRNPDDYGSIRRKQGAGNLSFGELQLGRSDLDQKPRRFFHRLGSHIARIQAVPHLFAGDLRSHKKAQKSQERSRNRFALFCASLRLVSCIISRDTPSV